MGSAFLPQMSGLAGYPAAPVVMYHGNRGLPNVAMTFDDCYNLDLLQGWADFLQNYPDAQVTFFPVGVALENAAAKKPDLWKNLFAQGHEMGYHGYTHSLPSSLSEPAALEDFKNWKTAAVNAAGTEIQVRFARPPFGELSYSFLKMCSEFDLKAAMWTHSWGMADNLFEKEKERAEKGDILLFHIREQDLENAKVALPYFLKHKLAPVTLTKLDALGHKTIDEWPACRPNPRKVCPI